MQAYADTNDIVTMWRALTENERSRAEVLLEVASDTLRQVARDRGYDLDQMILDETVYTTVVKDVVIAAVTRVLRSSTTSEPMTQFSQAALGYSISGTYLNPQGGMFFYDNELNRLGLRKRQRLGRIDLYAPDRREDGCPV